MGGGHGDYGGDQSGGGWQPDYSRNMGPKKISYDSRVFETKVALEKVSQYDGGKNGHSWKSLIKAYLISRFPAMGKLLQWAEDFKKTPITADHVMNLRMTMEDDPIVVAHLLWGFFNLNLVGEAREIFSNVEDSHGFEVWRRICNKINVRGENRLDELYEAIHHPKAAAKCSDVASVMEDWDTQQRLYKEAGGEPLRTEEKRVIVKKLVPEIIRQQLVLQVQEFKEWEAMKEYILERSRQLGNDEKPHRSFNAVDKDLKELDLDALAEMPLEDAVNALGGEHADSEHIMALVVRKQQRKTWSKGWSKGNDKGTPKGKGKGKTMICLNCGAEDHVIGQCPKPIVDVSQRPCFYCKKPGHLSSWCPNRPAKPGQPAKAVTPEQEDDDGEVQGLMVGIEDAQDNLEEWSKEGRHRSQPMDSNPEFS